MKPFAKEVVLHGLRSTGLVSDAPNSSQVSRHRTAKTCSLEEIVDLLEQVSRAHLCYPSGDYLREVLCGLREAVVHAQLLAHVTESKLTATAAPLSLVMALHRIWISKAAMWLAHKR